MVDREISEGTLEGYFLDLEEEGGMMSFGGRIRTGECSGEGASGSGSGSGRLKKCGLSSGVISCAGPIQARSTGSRTIPFKSPSRIKAEREKKKYRKMKSNSEKASMATPSSVDTAPWTTGFIVCSSEMRRRRSLEPIVVKKAMLMWRENSTERPTETMRMTAGMADSLMPRKPMRPNSSMTSMPRTTTTTIETQGLRRTQQRIRNVAAKTAAMARKRYQRRWMYCWGKYRKGFI